MKKIFFLTLALSFVLAGCSLADLGKGGEDIGVEAAKTKAAEFINNNLLQAGMEASVGEIVEEGGLYKLTVNIKSDQGDQELTSFLSKDGKMFFPQVYDIAEIESQKQANGDTPDPANAPAAVEIPKAEKARAELFVMSFCPYGVQAEAAMAPVVELLGDKADIDIRFIASLDGDNLAAVQSLHGTIEGIEDARQLCVAKNYNTDTLWKYVVGINKDCYPIYRNGEDAYNTCWQNAAKNAGINTRTIDTCVSKEGAALIKAEDAAAKNYGVTGSPTLIINGVKYQGGRTAEAYKQGICSGFENPPAECSETLNSSGAAASGDCN